MMKEDRVKYDPVVCISLDQFDLSVVILLRIVEHVQSLILCQLFEKQHA